MEKKRAGASREERRVVKIEGRKSWMTLTELRSKLDGTPTKHVLAVWDSGERTTQS